MVLHGPWEPFIPRSSGSPRLPAHDDHGAGAEIAVRDGSGLCLRQAARAARTDYGPGFVGPDRRGGIAGSRDQPQPPVAIERCQRRASGKPVDLDLFALLVVPEQVPSIETSKHIRSFGA